MNFFKKSFRGNALIGGVMLLLVHLIYGRTLAAGFVTDFTGMQERLDGASFWGFLDCFGFPALHQGTNFFLYFFHKWFGQNGLPWYLVFTSMHVLNGMLGYHLGKKIMARSGIPSPEWMAFFASLLFLLNPYQSEVVVWKVCFNFLLSTALALGSLLLFFQFIENGKNKWLWWSHGLFALGLFTFELPIVIPFILLAFWLIWKTDNSNGIKIFAPQISILALYFGLNKILFGGWVGHYGESTHLKFQLSEISSNLFKYFTKYLTLWRDWPGALKQQWMGICESETNAYIVLVVGAFVVLSGIFLWKKMNGRLQSTWLFWLLFFIALLPVANLYVPWLLHCENDRYGYFASLFFYFGLISLLCFLPKILKYPILIALVGISIFQLQKMATYWQQNAQVINSLLDDFRWENTPEIYVLAMPENLKGTPLLKDFSGEHLMLRHALKYGKGIELKGDIFQIAQYNLAGPEDGLTVTSDSTHHFKTQFNQWGNWWWRNGIGTGSYDTEKYEFKSISRGSEIWIKDPKEGAVFIYSDGGKWKPAMGNEQ